MSESFELEKNLNRICKELPDAMANAALVHLVGTSAGLNMAVDPVTHEPRNLSAARELTARFLEEARQEVKAKGPYAYEERDPHYFELLSGVMGKAAEYKQAFRDGDYDHSRGLEH